MRGNAGMSATTEPAPQLWTPEDFAAFAQLTKYQVEHLRKTGKGPAFTKIGRRVRYVPGTVRRWIAENQQTTTTKDSK